MTDLTPLTGVAAGVLTTVAFVPQVWRAWRTRSTADLSLGMLLTFVVGLVLWIVYGAQLREVPIIISNAVTLTLALTLVVLKLRNDRPSRTLSGRSEPDRR